MNGVAHIVDRLTTVADFLEKARQLDALRDYLQRTGRYYSTLEEEVEGIERALGANEAEE